MCNEIYYWDIDKETGFRKLVIKEFQTEFETEIVKFNIWNGEHKHCKYCSRNLPKSDYFFQNWKQSSDGLFFKCKECEGNKFTWGKNKKAEFKKNNLQYCSNCDVVYPLNEIYFVRDKKSSSGYARFCKQCATYKSEFGINRFLNSIIKDKKEDHQICLECHLELPHNEVYYFRNPDNREKSTNKFETKCKKCRGVNEYKVSFLNFIYKDSIPNGCKICTDCLQVLPKNEFYIKDRKINKRYSRCKRCHYISNRNRRHDKLNSDYSYDDWLFATNYWTDSNENIHCAYCDDITDNPEMEHIHPFSSGGRFTINNIIPSCITCNRSKHIKTLDEFYEYSDKFTYELYEKVLNYIKLTSEIKEVV